MAKAIEFENRYQNVGASLVKQVASATNHVAGDGMALLLSTTWHLLLLLATWAPEQDLQLN